MYGRDMIEKLLKNTYLMFHKVKVIHSIPGRIRVFVPFLNEIPENFKKYEDYVKDIIKLKTRTHISVRVLFRSYKRAGDSLCT